MSASDLSSDMRADENLQYTPVARSVLRRRLDMGEDLERNSDEDTSSSDTEGEYNGSEEEISTESEEEDDDEVFVVPAAFLPPMVRCQHCLRMREVNKIASPELRNRTLQSLADALNEARHNFTRVVRYGHFHMQTLNLVDPRSLFPANLRFARGRDIKFSNDSKRYRVLAPVSLCEHCVGVIERIVESYYARFGVPDVKEPEEEESEEL